MKRTYLHIMLVLVAICAFVSCVNADTYDQIRKTDVTDQTEESGLSVNLERMDHSVKNDNGETVAVSYFDKLIVTGDSSAAVKINIYFEDEYTSWLEGTGNRLSFYYSGEIQRFEKNLNDLRTALGDNEISMYPFERTVDTKIIYEDKDVISILQTDYCYFGGPSRTTYFGSTFNLHTGELIPFTYFADVKADDFRNSLSTFLIDSNIDTHFHSDEELRNSVNPNSDHNFEYEADYHLWDFSYEYFYDGTSIYLTENNIGNTSYILQWNGKTSDQFNATLFRLRKDIELLLEGFMKRNN